MRWLPWRAALVWPKSRAKYWKDPLLCIGEAKERICLGLKSSEGVRGRVRETHDPRFPGTKRTGIGFNESRLPCTYKAKEAEAAETVDIFIRLNFGEE
jgi:hypothetical protein